MAGLRLLLVFLSAMSSAESMGWGQQKGRSWGWSASQWRPSHNTQPAQVIRIEVDRGESSQKQERQREHSRRHQNSSYGRKREYSWSSSDSSSSHSRRRHSKKKEKKPRRGKSDRENRLEKELQMLQAEKAAREATAEKDKLMQEMESKVAAVQQDLLAQLSKFPGARAQPDHKPGPPKNQDQGQNQVKDQPLTPAEKMAIFHALGSYEGVKECNQWSEFESRLAKEDMERLKVLFRHVHRRGNLPRSTATIVPKILAGLKASLEEFAQPWRPLASVETCGIDSWYRVPPHFLVVGFCLCFCCFLFGFALGSLGAFGKNSYGLAVWDVAWAIKTLSWDYPATTRLLHFLTGTDISGAALNVCFVLGGCLIPYILPNSCERFAGARVLPFNSCSLQAAIIN